MNKKDARGNPSFFLRTIHRATMTTIAYGIIYVERERGKVDKKCPSVNIMTKKEIINLIEKKWCEHIDMFNETMELLLATKKSEDPYTYGKLEKTLHLEATQSCLCEEILGDILECGYDCVCEKLREKYHKK